MRSLTGPYPAINAQSTSFHARAAADQPHSALQDAIPQRHRGAPGSATEHRPLSQAGAGLISMRSPAGKVPRAYAVTRKRGSGRRTPPVRRNVRQPVRQRPGELRRKSPPRGTSRRALAGEASGRGTTCVGPKTALDLNPAIGRQPESCCLTQLDHRNTGRAAMAKFDN